MAQLDSEQVLCCGPEAAASPVTGEQRCERGDSAVHPEQEQLSDPHVSVQPTGRDRHPEPTHLSAGPTTPETDLCVKMTLAPRDTTLNEVKVAP